MLVEQPLKELEFLVHLSGLRLGANNMTATANQKSQSQQWHHLPAREVFQQLDSNLETGLTSAEAAKRQERYGSNELKGKPGKSPLLRFLLQFNQPLLYILLIAGAIKAFL